MEELIENADIITNSDLDGNQTLKSLAKNSNIFVITWLSAKHAATEFIRQNKGSNCEIIYSPGKGSSSIVSAIENHINSSNYH